ncbi:polyprenol phosphomannose-dependent alpha 1,6 mannosyltransferase MptB [Leekyejoonella antrihumi]|uniref:DUF2029 domain-containing protein n=1 Tax=Leekyejoonella antrihumi TaxID=1660198 RepID=A0A563E6M7_9MICO|nr:polyprenol phosphomannose-dependent alpha 1,6 mannosyltransferase MptB [Leekyejoonella antrihumi]TWP38157.1 hypothetical protein FGL98_02710 [Leekyejoonella antrihumi]
MTAFERVRTPLLWIAFALLVLVGLAQTSAAKPPLGLRGFAPGMLPWEPSSLTVTVILFLAYSLGAAGVLLGLLHRTGRSASWPWVFALAVLALLTGPFGSGDHTNYAAYGRIAVQGGDPYSQSPIDWRGGLDPITAAVQPPWQHTPSIYGPFATSLQAFSNLIGGDNLRETVWIWQIFVVASWLVTRWLLRQIAWEERSRRRIDVLWTFNPLVFGVLVLGAHVDAIAGVLAVAALVTMRRSALATGVLVGTAASTKLTYAVVALGIIWAWRQCGEADQLVRRVRNLVLGVLLILVPCFAVAGPHAFHQFGAAGGSFSYASPWSLVIRLLRTFLPEWAVTTVAFVLAAATMIALSYGFHRVANRYVLGRWIANPMLRQAVATTFALNTAYVVAAPYSLPWYDTLTWALLPLLAPFAWDPALVVRYLFMALAYVPGRVQGVQSSVETWTLGFRENVSPWVGWIVLGALAVWMRRAGIGRPAPRTPVRR